MSPGQRDTVSVPETDAAIGRGIAAIVVAMFLLSITDAAVKWLGHAGYAATQIAFFRYLFGLVPVAVMIWRNGGRTLRIRRPGLHLIRIGLIFTTSIAFYTGLRYMPLAEAVAIAFTAPLFVTVFSWPLLGERVGRRRWGAVAAGFVGAVIMLQPGTAAFRAEAILILVAALTFALAMLLTRRMAATETNTAIFAYSTLGAWIVSVPFVAFAWQVPVARDLWVFLMLGLVGGCGSYLVIVAYRHAPAALIASFDYTSLVWATLFGWVLWQERPGPAVWVGAAVIVTAGLYIIHREGRRPSA
jgi:drug/metabolite transporter (DMT)-like permease